MYTKPKSPFGAKVLYDFPLNREGPSSLARFREPVWSVMLFWPVDTSSYATTKGERGEGEEGEAFKQHILNVFFYSLHLLCCSSSGPASRPEAVALTRLPAMVSGHTIFTSMSIQLPQSVRNINTLATTESYARFPSMNFNLRAAPVFPPLSLSLTPESQEV